VLSTIISPGPQKHVYTARVLIFSHAHSAKTTCNNRSHSKPQQTRSKNQMN